MTFDTITLDKFAYGGECFGRLADGRAVFVPFCLPGERVQVRLVEERKGYARAQLVQVLDVSPQRVAARCPHYQHCGGCHYQHMAYEYQLDAKKEVLVDQLTRIGKIEDPPVQAVVSSPSPWNYRNQVQFHLTSAGQLGYQGQRSHQVVPIQECHLPEDHLNQLWPILDLKPIPGMDRLVLRVGIDGDALLVLESSDPEPVELLVDLPISVVHSGPGGLLVLAGDDYLLQEILGRPFQVSARSFFQVNTPMAEAMVRYVLAHLSLSPEATLVDAYCGVGLFSAFLAPRVKRLVSIEDAPSACNDFVTNLDEYDHVELYEAPVEAVLPVLDFRPEVILVDPPRAGLDRQALDGILYLAPETLVYVSCDPATLGRDARRLVSGGYHLSQITPFDLFPQTFHIESISFWHRT
jgi:23S rRNA (uracil1939-C5)-methyltransferase